MGDVPGIALPGLVHRGALSGPPVRTRPGRPHTAAQQLHRSRPSSARSAQRFRRWSTRRPAGSRGGNPHRDMGRRPARRPVGGPALQGAFSHSFLARFASGAPFACVESPTVRDPSAHSPQGALLCSGPTCGARHMSARQRQWARTDGSPHGPLSATRTRLSDPLPARSHARPRPCRSGAGGRYGSRAP